VLPIRSVLVDFDGTVCLHDVGVCLLRRFGAPGWERLGEAYDRGEMGLRELISAEMAMLLGTRAEMLAFVLEHCPMDPTFAAFVSWLGDRDVPITIVSDGAAFHIEDLLAREGIHGIRVMTNDNRFGSDDRHLQMRYPNAHPACVGCGTCKMQAVLNAREDGPVAFVGDGVSDRFAALYSDVVFAKGALPTYCEDHGVAYLTWHDFRDVRRALEDPALEGEPVAPAICPGWTDPR
jgi:2-hydroxy-3-keto-5-methylthiopentenyl-1-phosphate phosphatase